MDPKNWIGEEPHKIRISEVDSTGFATFPALLDLLQEVAWNNSAHLNFSVYDMMERGYTWVVYRMQFHIHRYPRHYDKVIAKSWPSGKDRLYTYRDYQLLAHSGDELIRGTSAWLVFDIEKRKPIPIPEFFNELKFPPDVVRMDMNNSKLPLASNSQSQFQVRYQDIDVNRHTNNVNYITWVMEDLFRSKGGIVKPQEIDMVFRGETVLGDQLETFMNLEGESTSIHLIRDQDTGKEIFQARINY